MHQPRAGGTGTGPWDPRHHPQQGAGGDGDAAGRAVRTRRCAVSVTVPPPHGPVPQGTNGSPLPLAFGGHQGPPSPAGPPRHRPAAVVVAAHEHLAAAAADGAVGLVAVVVVLVRALQEAVLGGGGARVSACCVPPPTLCWATQGVWGQGALGRGPPTAPYLAVLAHPPDEQRVLQGDVEAPAGDADIWRAWGGGAGDPGGSVTPPRTLRARWGRPAPHPCPFW